MAQIAVLGSGMGGLGAAYHLQSEGVRPVIYDKADRHGGHTLSWSAGGFVFDQGPHVSFTKDERIQRIFAEFVGGDYLAFGTRLDNYWRGHRLTHPVQLHLHGLPEDLIVEIITDFIDEQGRPDRKIENYEDWLYASYGKKFAELFPLQYTRKYHTTPASNMTTEWLGPRMYRQSLDEMLRGALSPWEPGVHYNSDFRYPTTGGFEAYLQTFPEMGDLQLEHELVGMDPRARKLRFRNGSEAGYDGVVSSIPLPDLVPLIDGVPRDVVEAAGKLACTTVVLVNVGVRRADLSETHMTYFYDEDICFSRISFPHMLAPSTVPEGCGAVQAEVYFSDKYRPLAQDPKQLIEPAIADLTRVGTLREDDEIVFRDARVVKYGNVIFDLDRAAALETVHGYLDDVGIAYCGRYGDWDYMWTDQSFISGERAAQTALRQSGA